jgi:hypothetical protein
MKDKHFIYLLLIGLILIIFAIIFPFVINHFFNDWQKSGNFGDTYGALNALFSGLAFAGLIITILIQKIELQNQRKDLELQRNEMIETRKEFLLNRTTNLIYSQLDRFERSLKELKILYKGNEYVGNDAITILNEIKEITIHDDQLSVEDNLENRKLANYRQSKVHIDNKTEIEKFAHSAFNSVNVLKSIIYKSELAIEDLNDLKNLFFENIGFINMGIIENISDLAIEQVEIFTVDDFVRFDMDVGKMIHADIFLKSIKEFYHTSLNKGNFEKLKEDWLKSKGSNY